MTWLIYGQCQEVTRNKKAYQLVKDLTTQQHGTSATIREHEILSVLHTPYNYETDGDPMILATVKMGKIKSVSLKMGKSAYQQN